MRRLQPTQRSGIGTSGLVWLACVLGLGVYLYPFLLPAINTTTSGQARTGEAPILLTLLMVLIIAAILRELDPMRVGEGASRTIALLAALVAIGAISRLIPSFLGATPIFLLVILSGYVFGPAFGFQVGALTLAVSAFITGGMGPWVPYQMLGVGWVGMGAGFLPVPASRNTQIGWLAAYGAISGLLFGALLNLWFWPFTAPGADVQASLAWTPDLTLAETVQRYARFYLITSFWFDFFRAIGNVVLILLLAKPLLGTLERYRDRFHWISWDPESDNSSPSASTA
jgi:energy-coupling factor transport system substrate-specific component